WSEDILNGSTGTCHRTGCRFPILNFPITRSPDHARSPDLPLRSSVSSVVMVFQFRRCLAILAFLAIDSPIYQISQTLVILSGTERRQAQGKFEGPRHRVPCHAALGSSLETTGTMCFDFQLPNYQITHLANLADPITRSSSAFLCVLC